jgi:uncharacterized membrane protein YcaP (DUF421 family)
MHLFSHAEHLTIMEWISRAVTAYIFLLFVAKMMGQRSIAQLHFLDVVLALLLGGNLSNPLTDERLDLTGPMITTFVLVILHVLSSTLSLKWEWWRRFLEPSPLLLIRNGELQIKNLRRARISIDYLLSELRMQKIEALEKVAIALWEPNGNISAFRKQEYEPISRKDVNLEAEAFSMPVVVIKEGKVRKEALLSIGKTEEWLQGKIGKNNIKDLLLATADSSGEVRLIFRK